MKNLDYSDIPIDHQCTILNHSEKGILAIEKSIGVLTHPNKEYKHGKPKRTLLHADYLHNEECYCWINKSGEYQKLFLVHRLDSPTSGIILTTTNFKLANSVKAAFSNKKVLKTYYALVKPKAKIKEGIWKDHLKEKREEGNLRVSRGNGSAAITRVNIERKKSGSHGLVLLRMQPLTGRTHQLRVQCAIRGLPIVGDKSYGDFNYNRKIAKASKIDRLCLHAAEISLKINVSGKETEFSADSPLPRSFGKLLT